MAVRYGQLAFQHMQHLRVKKPSRASLPQTVAFLGRTCVNIGSGYGGTASTRAHYATILAYWHCGEDLLSQAEAEDVIVPRDNIAGLKRLCTQQMGSEAFEQVWQESLSLYQEIQAVLISPDEVSGPHLTQLLEAATAPSLHTSPASSSSRRGARKKRE